MTNPTGESEPDALRLDFDRRLRLLFRGSVVTSDAGLLAYRCAVLRWVEQGPSDWTFGCEPLRGRIISKAGENQQATRGPQRPEFVAAWN
jgi:hypothetical protein